MPGLSPCNDIIPWLSLCYPPWHHTLTNWLLVCPIYYDIILWLKSQTHGLSHLPWPHTLTEGSGDSWSVTSAMTPSLDWQTRRLLVFPPCNDIIPWLSLCSSPWHHNLTDRSEDSWSVPSATTSYLDWQTRRLLVSSAHHDIKPWQTGETSSLSHLPWHQALSDR